jgi:hypothetical protein
VCGLCGVLNHADHWTNGPAIDGGGIARPGADRRLRALAANDILSLFGLKLESWAGRYTLRSRTGKMAVVDNLGSLWVEAERLTGQACDPLDPMVLTKLGARSR